LPVLRTRCCSLAALFLALLLTAAPTRAQEDTSTVAPARPDVDLALGGTLQPRFSYGRTFVAADPGADAPDRVGFGIRRARLRFEATLAGRTGVYVQLAAGGTTVGLLDALLFYDLTDALRLRLGRLAAAQPRAAKLTSHKHIDLTARAAIARRWGDATLGNSGRDFGLEALYETDRVTAQAGLYNGNGNWSRALGNFREDITGDPTGGLATRGLSVAAYGAWRPAALEGVEVGGFIGRNAARNAASTPPSNRFSDGARSYTSYSGHLYWGPRPGSQPVRLEADLIGTRYETLSAGNGAFDQHALGASLLGAVGLFDQSAELLARVERYDPALDRDDDAVDYVSAGASLSVSALRGRPYERQRLTLAYSTRLDDADPHLLVVQAQVLF
jgi:hypothetical protein